MLDSADLPEGTDLFVSVRCANRMGLDAVSDNTNFIELDTALPHAGEIFLSSRRRLCALFSRYHALTFSSHLTSLHLTPSSPIIWALTLASGPRSLVRYHMGAHPRARPRPRPRLYPRQARSGCQNAGWRKTVCGTVRSQRTC